MAAADNQKIEYITIGPNDSALQGTGLLVKTILLNRRVPYLMARILLSMGGIKEPEQIDQNQIAKWHTHVSKGPHSVFAKVLNLAAIVEQEYTGVALLTPPADCLVKTLASKPASHDFLLSNSIYAGIKGLSQEALEFVYSLAAPKKTIPDYKPSSEDDFYLHHLFNAISSGFELLADANTLALYKKAIEEKKITPEQLLDFATKTTEFDDIAEFAADHTVLLWLEVADSNHGIGAKYLLDPKSMAALSAIHSNASAKSFLDRCLKNGDTSVFTSTNGATALECLLKYCPEDRTTKEAGRKSCILEQAANWCDTWQDPKFGCNANTALRSLNSTGYLVDNAAAKESFVRIINSQQDGLEKGETTYFDLLLHRISSFIEICESEKAMANFEKLCAGIQKAMSLNVALGGYGNETIKFEEFLRFLENVPDDKIGEIASAIDKDEKSLKSCIAPYIGQAPQFAYGTPPSEILLRRQVQYGAPLVKIAEVAAS